MERLLRNTLFTAVAVLLLIVVFSFGILVGVHPGVRASIQDALALADGGELDFGLQEEVLDELESNYYRDVEPAELQDDAIRGMLSGLEEAYTTYMSPEEYERFREHSGGQYSGVGMSVEEKNGLVTVVATFEGSPAGQAGIEPGDIITAVDRESVRGKTLEEVVTLIKGPEGSTVDMEVYRPPADAEPLPEDLPQDQIHLPEGGEALEFTLERREIEIPVVEAEMLDVDGQDVLYLQFFTFSQESSEKLRDPLEQYVEQGDADAVILDLRRNGGGLLSEAVDVASLFIEDGTIVTTEGLHSPKQVYEAEGQAFDEVPLYVLIDEFSASASEIVAGALQDTGRGTLVGDTSFGKGLVQTIEPLSNGGALKVTTAVYLTPKGRNINEKGIEPDVEAPDLQETEDVDETLERVRELIAEEN